MQIQYSAVAAGNGSNPKSPPPVSALLKQYILCALHVQEAVDDLQEDPLNEVFLYVIRSNTNAMLVLYEQMNEYEREIVEGSHIPPYTARFIGQHVEAMIIVFDTEDEDVIRSAAATMSFILYTNKAIETSCSHIH